jgi:hypothetical protein
VRPLGSGGSGSVWLAHDERNGLDVALKIIPREGKAAARAEREALAARRLRHDRCVRAYHVGHDTSHIYIAYEYVPGRTLREALRSQVLTDQDVVEVAAQVLEALAHAHRAGIVHRDVKPSNILLEHRDDVAVRLLDFGLAQFDGADTLTAVGDVPGTLAYIAPERLAGGDATPESDVWAVGVLLWEALAGKHPFWGMPLQEVASAIHAGAPPLATERRELPRRLLTAVDRALAPEPRARPRASAFAADLRAAVRTTPGPEERRSPVTRATEPRRRAQLLDRRAVPALLAVLTTALGATLLPFWPPLLVAAIIVLAGLAAWFDPRVGLAVALAAPIFPLGNYAESAALLYGAFALGWLVLSWRDARAGLLFASGPLLAPFGLLAVVPLIVQPARGALRRGAQAGLAVLATALCAGVSGRELPFTDSTSLPVGITPRDSVGDAALALWEALSLHSAVVGAAVVAAATAVVLPHVRGRSRYGIAAIGLTLVAVSLVAGVALGSVLMIALLWATAAAVAAVVRR